ncbi:hypothetical protein HKCCSP123_00875 [Rhodobacterales bacterium HKCCSP123]|nr:hypothetical protein [Rhodobacterales bacterium HKCCSP123]
MLVEPAETWIAVMEKSPSLLEQYSATPDADNNRIKRLIERAVSDPERVKKREERT